MVTNLTLGDLSIELKSKAEEYGFNVRYVGGLLKFTPKNVFTKVMLELEHDDDGFVKIYKHRTQELTNTTRGRKVSKCWIIGFMEANSTEAKKETLLVTKLVNEKIPENDKTIPLYGWKFHHKQEYRRQEECNACGKPLNYCVCGR